MTQLEAVSRDLHSSKYWKRFEDYAHARPDMVVPLAAQELPRALLDMPLAFMSQDGHVVPAALLGLAPGRNLFVAPDGRWLGAYVPAFYRSYPFRLASTGEGQQILAIDADSGLICDAPGEAFFDGEGQPAPAIQEILGFLNQIQASRAAAARTCQLLADHGLIRPWPISVPDGEGHRQLDGLYCIDEAALNALPDEAFLTLRRAGALSLAYCQLLSMQNLQKLGQLAHAHDSVQAQAQAAALVQAQAASSGQGQEVSFLHGDGIIDFNALT